MQVEWERCLNYLHGMLSDTVFKTYFAQTKLVSQTPGHAVIAVPPGLDVKVYAAYKDLIRLAWKDVSHDDAPVEFEFQPQDVYQPQVSSSEAFRFLAASVSKTSSRVTRPSSPSTPPSPSPEIRMERSTTRYLFMVLPVLARRTCSSPSVTTFSKKTRPSV